MKWKAFLHNYKHNNMEKESCFYFDMTPILTDALGIAYNNCDECRKFLLQWLPSKLIKSYYVQAHSNLEVFSENKEYSYRFLGVGKC
ncbi:hypothetical protein EGI32_12950 [Ferruginibacter sp. HRS2-29]|nr:hypothetical protein [Ferruginibacter sp. HRS2-29]